MMYREDAMASKKPKYKPKTVIIKLIKPKKTVKDENIVIDQATIDLADHIGAKNAKRQLAFETLPQIQAQFTVTMND